MVETQSIASIPSDGKLETRIMDLHDQQRHSYELAKSGTLGDITTSSEPPEHQDGLDWGDEEVTLADCDTWGRYSDNTDVGSPSWLFPPSRTSTSDLLELSTSASLRTSIVDPLPDPPLSYSDPGAMVSLESVQTPSIKSQPPRMSNGLIANCSAASPHTRTSPRYDEHDTSRYEFDADVSSPPTPSDQRSNSPEEPRNRADQFLILTPSILLRSDITPSPQFVLFSEPLSGVDTISPHALFDEQRWLFEQPISQIFSALREVEQFQGLTNHVELALSIPELGLKVSEDNVHSYEISLKDIHEVYAGCELPEPMTLEVNTIAPRFITRFKAIAEELSRVIAASVSPRSDNGTHPLDTWPPAFGSHRREQSAMRVDNLDAGPMASTEVRHKGPGGDVPMNSFRSLVSGNTALNRRVQDDGFSSDFEEEYGADADVEELGSPLGEPLLEHSTTPASAGALNGLDREDDLSPKVVEAALIYDRKSGPASVVGSIDSTSPRQTRPPFLAMASDVLSKARRVQDLLELETGHLSIPSYAASPTTTIDPTSSPTLESKYDTRDHISIATLGYDSTDGSDGLDNRSVDDAQTTYRDLIAERRLLASSIPRVASASSKRSYEDAFEPDEPEGQLSVNDEQSLYLKRVKI